MQLSLQGANYLILLLYVILEASLGEFCGPQIVVHNKCSANVVRRKRDPQRGFANFIDICDPQQKNSSIFFMQIVIRVRVRKSELLGVLS